MHFPQGMLSKASATPVHLGLSAANPGKKNSDRM
jgi:hypothetical protein